MKRQKGFTLIELMVTVGVGAILLSVAVPSFRSIIMDNRLVTQANQFVTSVNLARSTAVRYQRNATVCPSANFNANVPTCSATTDWSAGWIVWVDKDRDGATDTNEILSVQEPLDDSTAFSAATAAQFSYDARGFGASPAGILTLCDTRDGETGRSIKVNTVGRTNVSREVCTS